MVVGTFGMFGWAEARNLPIENARTMVVNTLVVMEIFYLFSVRYVHGTSLTWRGVFGTRAVLIGVGIVVVAQLAFTYLPPMQAVFGTRDLSIGEGAAIIAVGFALLVCVEVEKRLFALFGGVQATRRVPPARTRCSLSPGPGQAWGRLWIGRT